MSIVFWRKKQMKCFIHFNQEAVAACRTCGKGMCASCSAYSGHSGVCPECRKKEFEKERLDRINNIKNLKWNIFVSAALTFLLCWTVIFGIVYGVKWYKAKVALQENEAKINYLSREIDKLNKALSNRSANATI